MKNYILIFYVVLFVGSANAQNKQQSITDFCPSTAHTEKLSPQQIQDQANFEQLYQQEMLAKKNGKLEKNAGVLYTIPTVVHVIHNGAPIGATTNMSSADVIAIIDETNERFRHVQANAPSFTNPNYGADTEIELCMASTNPEGNYTNGVMRYYLPDNFTGTYNELGGLFNAMAWDKSQYLNIFLADLTNAAGVYMGGYDIVIMQSTSFWSGLTNHEVGHYFTLPHTFNGCENGDCLTGGDRVCDTPPKDVSGYNGGTCAAPGNTCTTDEDDTSTNNPYRAVALGGMGDQPDMLENYMDYTGGCWDAFTIGQKDRMRLNISTTRASMLTSPGCDPQAPPTNDAALTTVDVIGGCTDTQKLINVTIQNLGIADLNSLELEVYINSVYVSSQVWTGNLIEGASEPFILNPITFANGTSTLEVRAVNPNNTTDENIANNSVFQSVYVNTSGVALTLNINFDNYPGETSWEIQDDLGNVVTSGSGYSGASISESICISAACYDFIIKDSYGDGICCTYGTGSYELLDPSGNVLASGGEFASADTTAFCLAGACDLVGDLDGDGVCADVDCDDNDINVGASQAQGTACDDNNAGTENDVILADGCTCEGSAIPCFNNGGDADGDGVCADVDCDDNDINVGASQAQGTACDDNDAETENDVILADGCTCAGQCVGFGTNDFIDNPLSHSGTGSNSTNLVFTENRIDLSFTISGINSLLSGNPNKQYNEEVVISYLDAAGNTIVYGTFINVSTVDVLINEEVQSLNVSLTDGQDGDSGTSLMEINMTAISSCPAPVACISLDVKMWLEGAYDANSNSMSNELYNKDLLPSLQPYGAAPWTYAGTEGQAWTKADYPANTVDWVLVSLRTALDPATEVYRGALLLLNDGQVVFAGDCIPSTNLTGSSYYILVEHRNHMGAISHVPVDLLNNTLSYYFSAQDSYNTNTTIGQKEISAGNWVLLSGDLDQSDAPSYDITGSDKEVWSTENGDFGSYSIPDVNLNGDINGADKALWEINSGNFSGVPK